MVVRCARREVRPGSRAWLRVLQEAKFELSRHSMRRVCGDWMQLLNGQGEREVLRDTPGSWLLPFLLLCIKEESSAHELRESIDELGFRRVSAKELHAALREMEREGLISSGWNTAISGLPRRRYGLTGSGEAYLEFWVDSLQQYRKEMDIFLEFYDGRARREGSL